MEIKFFYWRNENLILVDQNNNETELVNPYPISIKIGGLEYSNTEEVTIVGSNHLFDKYKEKQDDQI